MTAGWDELILLLNTALAQRGLYFVEHPRVLAACDAFTAKLREIMAAAERDVFFLGVVDGRLVHDGRYLVGSTIAGKRLIALAESLDCGGFLFRAGLGVRELGGLLDLAAETTESLASLDEARRRLADKGAAAIELSPPYTDEGWFGRFLFDGADDVSPDGLDDDELQRMLPVYQGLFDTVARAHEDAGRDGAIDMPDARTISEQLVQATRGDFVDLMQIVRYPDYDSYTVGHSVRVALIMVMVGHRLGADQGTLVELGAAGLLHDVGKSRIPQEILFKPGRLDPDERAVIEQHPVLGAEILLDNRDAGSLAVAAAWGHHLRHDGTGYPDAPPWAARGRATSILHVCDVYEALTAVRPYKRAYPPRRAFEIMLGSPGMFEPAALTTFVRAMGLYPPGSQVRLTSGARGIVVAAGADIERPRVRLTHDVFGEPYAGGEAPIVDLGREGASLQVGELVMDA